MCCNYINITMETPTHIFSNTIPYSQAQVFFNLIYFSLLIDRVRVHLDSVKTPLILFPKQENNDSSEILFYTRYQIYIHCDVIVKLDCLKFTEDTTIKYTVYKILVCPLNKPLLEDIMLCYARQRLEVKVYDCLI